MRRVLAAVVVASFATLTFGNVPASAICGGGQPGEPCYCPETKIIKIYC